MHLKGFCFLNNSITVQFTKTVLFLIICICGSTYTSPVPITDPWQSPCGTQSSDKTLIGMLFSRTPTAPTQLQDLTEYVIALQETIDKTSEYRQRVVTDIANEGILAELDNESLPNFPNPPNTTNVDDNVTDQELEGDYDRLSTIYIFVEDARLDRESQQENASAEDLKEIEAKLLNSLCLLFVKNIQTSTSLTRDLAKAYPKPDTRARRNYRDYIVTKDTAKVLESMKTRYQLPQ